MFLALLIFTPRVSHSHALAARAMLPLRPVRHRGHGEACYRLILEVPQRLTAKQREALAAFDAASKEERGPLSAAFFERMKKLFG